MITKVLFDRLPKDIIENEIFAFYNPYKEYFTEYIQDEILFHVDLHYPRLRPMVGNLPIGQCWCYCPYEGCGVGHDYRDSPYCDRHLKRQRKNVGNSTLLPSFVKNPLIPYEKY
jgi:hypothetical protein